jgi:hypothetical protein
MTITPSGDATLVVIWRQGSVVHGRRLKTGGTVAQTLRKFATDCAATLKPDAPLYDPDSPPEDDPQRTAPREEAYDTDLLDALSKGGSHPVGKPEDLDNHIVCWAVAFGVEEDRMVFVHKNSPIQLARKPLVAGFADATLTQMSDPVLAFDPNFDLVITPDKLYILDHKDFEGLFKDSDAVLARAKDWSKELTSKLPSTDGSAEAVEAILRRNGVVRRKVTSILRRPYFQTLDKTVLKERLKEHNLDETTYFPDEKLNFTAETIVTLVRLLNEDLFRGDFSSEQFAASGKQRLGTAPSAGSSPA